MKAFNAGGCVASAILFVTSILTLASGSPATVAAVAFGIMVTAGVLHVRAK